MNSLVEKFNSTNPDYDIVVSVNELPGNYWLSNKQGELCPEFDVGSFGINTSEVFTLLCKLFNECMGEGIRSRIGVYLSSYL